MIKMTTQPTMRLLITWTTTVLSTIKTMTKLKISRKI